jgi:hypothetical protein
MNHQTALENQVVERYVLGDLSPREQEEFEEHYFECEICGRAVSDAERWMEVARRAAAEQSAQESGWRRLWAACNPAWLRPHAGMAALAAFSLAGVVIYQNALTIPGLRALGEAQPLRTTMLRDLRSDAPQKVIALGAGENFFNVVVERGGTGQTTAECEIRAAAGTTVMRMRVPLIYGSASLLLPAARFPDGEYVLALTPTGGGERSEFRLHVRRSD